LVKAPEESTQDPSEISTKAPETKLALIEEKLRFVVGWVFVLLVLAFGLGASVAWILVDWNAPYLVSKIDTDFHAVIGLPAAAAGALMLVIFLRTTEGNIEFEAFGLKFKGASGPIILWVVVFLAIVTGIKVLGK
jgi:hypothetical protein